VTKKFEQKVARDMWGDARTSFGAPTRRKRERKTHLYMPDPADPAKGIILPAQEYPAGFVFYVMPKAGILQGLPPTIDLSSMWKLIMIDDVTRRKKFLARYGENLVLSFRNMPDAFGRLLAKIGYCHVLTQLNLGDFRPICLPYIIGKEVNLSYVVGGSMEDQQPDLDNGYILSTAAFGNSCKLMLVALVRLYAMAPTPAYHVAVGDVSGTENVARVLEKLGPRTEASRSEHWDPIKFPPFWSKQP
jgi:hypothetical protein